VDYQAQKSLFYSFISLIFYGSCRVPCFLICFLYSGVLSSTFLAFKLLFNSLYACFYCSPLHLHLLNLACKLPFAEKHLFLLSIPPTALQMNNLRKQSGKWSKRKH